MDSNDSPEKADHGSEASKEVDATEVLRDPYAVLVEDPVADALPSSSNQLLNLGTRNSMVENNESSSRQSGKRWTDPLLLKNANSHGILAQKSQGQSSEPKMAKRISYAVELKKTHSVRRSEVRLHSKDYKLMQADYQQFTSKADRIRYEHFSSDEEVNGSVTDKMSLSDRQQYYAEVSSDSEGDAAYDARAAEIRQIPIKKKQSSFDMHTNNRSQGLMLNSLPQVSDVYEFKQPELVDQPSYPPSGNIRFRGHKYRLDVQLAKSSVNYFILSFLPLIQIQRLQLLNKRFYKLYVPVTMGQVTLGGTVPINSRKLSFAIQLENDDNLMTLEFPRPPYDSAVLDRRRQFWEATRWRNDRTLLKYKRQMRYNDMKQFNYNVSWSSCVAFEFHEIQKNGGKEVRQLQQFLYMSGGCNFVDRSVSSLHIEINLKTNFVMKQKNIPRPKFAHGVCSIGQKIVITGGISDMLLDMGLRSVPIGDRDCYSFDVFSKEWQQLPDLPIGKMHPTLLVINSRFIYHLGGFDDYNYDIYRLDMLKPEKAWRTLKLCKTVPIIDESLYLETQEHRRQKAERQKENGAGRDSDDDSDIGTPYQRCEEESKQGAGLMDNTSQVDHDEALNEEDLLADQEEREQKKVSMARKEGKLQVTEESRQEAEQSTKDESFGVKTTILSPQTAQPSLVKVTLKDMRAQESSSDPIENMLNGLNQQQSSMANAIELNSGEPPEVKQDSLSQSEEESLGDILGDNDSMDEKELGLEPPNPGNAEASQPQMARLTEPKQTRPLLLQPQMAIPQLSMAQQPQFKPPTSSSSSSSLPQMSGFFSIPAQASSVPQQPLMQRAQPGSLALPSLQRQRPGQGNVFHLVQPPSQLGINLRKATFNQRMLTEDSSQRSLSAADHVMVTTTTNEDLDSPPPRELSPTVRNQDSPKDLDRPEEAELKSILGFGHLGVVLLPSTLDSFEQPHLNFSAKAHKLEGDQGAQDHSEIKMLVFGGSKFNDHEPNPHEYTDKCIMLKISPQASDYELQYLPGLRMKCPDKFFGNMQTRVDANHNTVTIIGQKAAHRINTGKLKPSHLRWKALKPGLGYGKATQLRDWKQLISHQQGGSDTLMSSGLHFNNTLSRS